MSYNESLDKENAHYIDNCLVILLIFVVIVTFVSVMYWWFQ